MLFLITFCATIGGLNGYFECVLVFAILEYVGYKNLGNYELPKKIEKMISIRKAKFFVKLVEKYSIISVNRKKLLKQIFDYFGFEKEAYEFAGLNVSW